MASQELPPSGQSGDEIFDVVDEADNVIGQRTRRDVHRLGLRHRAVHVLIFNQTGKIFLQKRSPLKDTHPRTWDSSSSGHLDVGEEYDDCAVREVREELGYQLPGRPERWLRITACAETGQEHIWIYKCEADGPFQLHPGEIETGDWFTEGEITSWMKERPEEFAPAFRLIWQRLALI